MPAGPYNHHNHRAIPGHGVGEPVVRRRRRRRVKWNSNYAKGVQGICKAFCMATTLLALIIIGSSPYGRPIYMREGVTWPFHIVMFLTTVSWILVTLVYLFFVTGQHLASPHVPWPTRELAFNAGLFAAALFAVILEAANLWRWDFSGGFTITSAQLGTGISGLGGTGGLQQFGIRPGSMNSQMAMQGYCMHYPRECNDVMALVTGINPYFGNHIFGLVMLIIWLLSISIGLVYSYLTYKRFKRDYAPGGQPPKPKVEEAPFLDKVRYQLWNFGTSVGNRSNALKDRLLSIVQRDATSDADSVADTNHKYDDNKGTEMRDFHDPTYAEEYSERSFDDFSDSEYDASIVKTHISSSKSSYPPSSYPPSYVSSPTKSYHSHSKKHHDDNRSPPAKRDHHGGSTKSKRSKSRDSRHKRREKARYEEEDLYVEDPPSSKPYDPNEPVASMIV